MGVVTLPAGMGKYYTYMNYNKITSPTSNQYNLRLSAKANNDLSYDSQGYAKIDDRYVVALTSTFGNVGDYVNINLKDGSTINAVIGDIKNQNDSGANKWGHNNGDVVVEYITNWNDNHSNPKSGSGVISIENIGSYKNFIPLYAGSNRIEDAQENYENTSNWLENKWNDILRKVICFIVLLFIGWVGVWYFMKAFNIDLKKSIVKAVV